MLGILREQLERHEADLVRSWATNTASADGGLGAGLSEGRAYDKRISPEIGLPTCLTGAGFRDAIDGAVGDPDHPVCRGDADDRAPAPAGDQVTAHLLAREEHALQVDVDDRVPLRLGTSTAGQVSGTPALLTSTSRCPKAVSTSAAPVTNAVRRAVKSRPPPRARRCRPRRIPAPSGSRDGAGRGEAPARSSSVRPRA